VIWVVAAVEVVVATSAVAVAEGVETLAEAAAEAGETLEAAVVVAGVVACRVVIWRCVSPPLAACDGWRCCSCLFWWGGHPLDCTHCSLHFVWPHALRPSHSNVLLLSCLCGCSQDCP
jgi:hypothetical protein